MVYESAYFAFLELISFSLENLVRARCGKNYKLDSRMCFTHDTLLSLTFILALIATQKLEKVAIIPDIHFSHF